MSLYLSPSVTPRTIYEAAAAGITGVKSYPAGVTTNSDLGVVSYEPFYPVFAAMEEVDMILNLHGEMPSAEGITVLNAEEQFIPVLLDLHKRFPKLRIVLEHCTTKAAVEAVKSCGPSVAATITAHHLWLTIDEAVGRPHNFCKPVAKLPSDREALIEAATSGSPKFFMGTDSAPHAKSAKEGAKTAAGCFTQAHAVAYVAEVFRNVGKLDMLQGFVSDIGRAFYKANEKRIGEREEKIVLSREPGEVIRQEYGEGEFAVVPFMSGVKVYSVKWAC
ncbi:Metallo-dependent hydrolase [Ascobolus immersus RN42]|uniref:Metallo-dependent hydrolase n=1 Tax=Ascobolus immersus RN42 TaxID=1160509 RepID=A0A3N4IJI6_ASCIM|nr:Metallo-dependent hydrolase [Ascobolus immersus RN42]